VNRSKNDPPDAEAIRAVVTRPTMRFVGVKSPESQVASLIPRAMPAPDL
jgi:transposase